MGKDINELISGVSSIIKDYRNLPDDIHADCIESVDKHVKKWISQFKQNDREFVLRHTYNLLSKNYYSEVHYDKLLQGVAKNKNNHNLFRNDCFLSIQRRSGSQREVLEKLIGYVQNEINFLPQVIFLNDDFPDLSGFNYITYFDDFSFSGKLIGDDVENFISRLELNNVNIRIVVFLIHSHGFYSLRRRLDKFVKENNLNIKFKFNPLFWGRVENSISDNFSWNTSIYFPEESCCNEILDEKGLTGVELYTPGYFRVGSHDECILGNESDRRRIERIFSSIGFDIISNSLSPKKSMKPLGFSTYYGFGFGGNVFSYRNCPNNTPLVFWWGNYEETGNAAVDCWYPLMKRRGNHD